MRREPESWSFLVLASGPEKAHDLRGDEQMDLDI